MSAGHMHAHAHATLRDGNNGWRLLCRSTDLDAKGLPLCHPLILPAFIIGLAGLVACIVGWAINLIPLIGALVVLPISMVYCMGVKSFHRDCRRCLKDRDRDPERPSSTTDSTYVGQDNWTTAPVSRKAMASPKRIGKRHSGLAAQQEKIKKLNSALENSVVESNGHVHMSNGVHQEDDGNHLTAGPIYRNGSLPDVESPSDIDLIAAMQSRTGTRNGSTNVSATNTPIKGSPASRQRDKPADTPPNSTSTVEQNDSRSSCELPKTNDEPVSDTSDGEESPGETDGGESRNAESDREEDASSTSPTSPIIDKEEEEEAPPPGYHQATNPAFQTDSERL